MGRFLLGWDDEVIGPSLAPASGKYRYAGAHTEVDLLQHP